MSNKPTPANDGFSEACALLSAQFPSTETAFERVKAFANAPMGSGQSISTMDLKAVISEIEGLRLRELVAHAAYHDLEESYRVATAKLILYHDA